MQEKDSQLFSRAKEVIAGGACSPVRSFKSLGSAPMYFKEAKGAYLISEDNKKYIDFCQAFGVNSLGHIDSEVKQAVDEVLAKAWTLGTAEKYSLDLAEWITSNIPFVNKVRFTVSGTEATMTSIRLARLYTGRSKIVKFEGCYHGHADTVFNQITPPNNETITIPLNNIELFKDAIAKHGKDIAAIIIEPLPANNGLLIQNEEYLKEVAEITKANGSLVILDEVITGFRVSLGGMAQRLGITPDLVCYGKIVGGGFPASCYGGREEIMLGVSPSGAVYQAGTFAAHPVAMVAGLETLKKLKKINGFNYIEELGNYLSAEINKQGKYKIAQYSGLFWLHNQEVEPKQTTDINNDNQATFFKSIFFNLVNKGIYLAPHALEVNFLTTAHTKEMIDTLIKALHESN